MVATGTPALRVATIAGLATGQVGALHPEFLATSVGCHRMAVLTSGRRL
jgi:hypothetical protein